eukprot:scaffold31815_cov118-Isochrysis_galbana.AAC.27
MTGERDPKANSINRLRSQRPGRAAGSQWTYPCNAKQLLIGFHVPHGEREEINPIAIGSQRAQITCHEAAAARAQMQMVLRVRRL